MFQNNRPTILMAGAMFAFALEDFFLKQSSTAMPTGQVIMLLGAAGGGVFWLIALTQGQPILDRRFFSPAAFIRTLSEALTTMLFVSALALIPLSLNAALLQAMPLVVTLGAIIFLKEPVRWRRWLAILIGLAGVMIILRPGSADFKLASLLTIASVITLAARDLATRVVPAQVGTYQLTSWAYLSLMPAGAVIMLITGDRAVITLSLLGQLWILGAIISGVLGYWAITIATRIGEASAIAPIRYLRLVFAMALGAILLGERPDAMTLIGAAIVVASGLYTILREARLKALSSKH